MKRFFCSAALFAVLGLTACGPETTSTSTSSNSSSSTLSGGSAINGGCSSFSSNNKKSEGSSCTAASDCVDYCCDCSGSNKSYNAYACIDGKCAGKSAACSAKSSLCN